MNTLPPQRLNHTVWKGVEEQLKQIFYTLVFLPVMDIITKNTAQSIELKYTPGSLLALMEALRTGQVQYVDGEFTGKFNVAISSDLRSIGGTFNAKTKVYSVPIGAVPGAVKAEAANYLITAQAVHATILRELNEISDRLDERLSKVNVDAYGALDGIEQGFKKSAEALQVNPQLDASRKKQLAKDYNESLKLPIKDFTQQSIGQLREAVEDNSMEGYRFDRLIRVVKQRYGVTANKAKFLARQETSLFMSKYRQQRFTQAGVTHYQWQTAHDERVRDSHKSLNGRIFSYASPPVTDRHTGAKNNPGEDYNCRCLDLPVLDKVAEYV